MHVPIPVFMREALREAQKNIRTDHGGPFGACIVLNGRVVAVSRNTVLRDTDPTCHAEINALRLASKKLKRFDLSDCVIYSTTEPCPMCFSAIHWARIPVIVYGTTIQDVATLGFNEMAISNQTLSKLAKTKTRIIAGFEKRACQSLLRRWDAAGKRKTY